MIEAYLADHMQHGTVRLRHWEREAGKTLGHFRLARQHQHAEEQAQHFGAEPEASQ